MLFVILVISVLHECSAGQIFIYDSSFTQVHARQGSFRVHLDEFFNDVRCICIHYNSTSTNFKFYLNNERDYGIGNFNISVRPRYPSDNYFCFEERVGYYEFVKIAVFDGLYLVFEKVLATPFGRPSAVENFRMDRHKQFRWNAPRMRSGGVTGYFLKMNCGNNLERVNSPLRLLYRLSEECVEAYLSAFNRNIVDDHNYELWGPYSVLNLVSCFS